MYIRKLAVILTTLVMLVIASPAAMAAESDSTWDQVKAAGSDLWGTVKEKAPGAWETTKNKASELYGKAKEKAPEVKEKVKTGVNNAQEKISDYREGEEEEFWQWFDNQTGGTTGDAQSNQNASASTPSADSATDSDQDNSTNDDLQEFYDNDRIYYYNPNGDDSREEAPDLPDEITINDKTYTRTPENQQELEVGDELGINDKLSAEDDKELTFGKILLFMAIIIVAIISLFTLGIRLIDRFYDKH